MLSVIIPHFNQHDDLCRLLRDLMPQAAAIGAEVIVVDNGSDPFPKEDVAAFPGVRLVKQPEKGPGPARNLGVAISRGERLAFIDADCRPASDWILQVLAGLDAAPILGGDVRIAVRTPNQPTICEAYEAEFAYRMEHYIRDKGFSGAGNLAMRREVFQTVGGFAGITVAEDLDWGRRAIDAGYRITWSPQVLVWHPARRNLADLARKWDRMIAHEAAIGLTTPADRWRWGGRALALLVSPIAAVPRIIRSTRIPGGWRGRLRAAFGLCVIRLHRARLMAGLLCGGSARHLVQRWRRSD